ncbi:hypothetical protein HME9304_01834 [Flagellimonas maritima]|uniref:Uncharacterized protein n=1 Tax=Flagellimonas maritima TaxID=1383885 RepID=A0A2Z4LSX6_9FLAO|nr:hypothetical protein HME9304_01834 [Allomuricauda aurantiaca]
MYKAEVKNLSLPFFRLQMNIRTIKTSNKIGNPSYQGNPPRFYLPHLIALIH